MPILEARNLLGLSPGKRYVLFAGKPRPEKRFLVIREAIKLLREHHNPEVDLLVATGMPHDQVPLYMNAADVLVLASRYEGSPMVVKEAMACNLPVVVTDVGDAREVIAGTDGCYITDGSVEDLVDKLRLAIDFGSRTNGREKVAHLSLDAVARRVVNVYERVVGRVA
jgi:glycosyltransferase involved in cell wall biosynthesis